MKLHELLDRELLGRMVDEGFVNLQVHPTQPLGILNYSHQAAFAREWNDVTVTCRGLIYDMTNYEIVARPFEKFFNYEEFGPDWVPPVGLVEVTDKKDGSLGILYPLPDGTWAVATRGSFASDQALHATKVFNERYKDGLDLDPAVTYLFEIIYPENRIVLNYGDMDDLVLLGGVVIRTGILLGPREARFMLGWPGPVTAVFNANSLREALALPPRENAEGVVVTFSGGERVKLKQADYVALHRIVTGMSERVVWERIGGDESVDDIKNGLPEEFWPWVDDVAGRLFAHAEEIIQSVAREYEELMQRLPIDCTRRDFAVAVKDSSNRAYMFNYLDCKPIWPSVWKSIKPAAARVMTNLTED